MSSSDDQGGAGRREVAYRLFAAEFEDADFSYSQSDEERAPNYVVTPTGARVNRLFLVGVLTEVEPAGEDILRARVVDPTGAFVVYAGQYQPDAQAFFERASPPAFVAVTGKARTFQPDDSDVTYTSVRPENVNEVTAETRDRWTIQTARQTLDRVSTMARALRMDERGDDLRRALESEGVDVGLAAGIPVAIDHYGTTGAYLEAVRTLATEAAEVVTGDRDEVESFATSPDTPGEADLAALAALDVATSIGGESETPAGLEPDEPEVDPAGSTGTAETETAESAESETADTAETETAGTTEAPETESASATETPDAETAESAATADSTVETTEEADATEESADVSAETDEIGDFDAEPIDTGTTEADTASPDAGATEGGAGDTDEGTGGDIGDFEPGEFDLDEEEREEIEEEFGTEFQSGTEVGDPGEADIDTPDPEDVTETESEPAAGEADAGEIEADESEADEAEVDEADEAEVDEADEAEVDEADEAEVDEAEAEEGDVEEAQVDETEVEEADADETDETEGAADADDVDLETAVMDAMREHDDGDGATEAEIVETVTARLGVGDDEVSEAIQDALMGGQCYEPDDGVYKPI